jgi:hypothetical protein
MFKTMKSWFPAKPAETPSPSLIDVHDPEIKRKLAELWQELGGADKISWKAATTIREKLQILEDPAISEHDFLLCRGIWNIMFNTMQQTAVRCGATAAFDKARRLSEVGIDFMHYVINPLLGLPPAAAADWGLNGITVDGRRVFPLLEEFMPDTAEQLVEAHLASHSVS